MPAEQFIDAWIAFIDEERAADRHEFEQRKLALAYAHANNLPEPTFPLERLLPEERPRERTCPCCGSGVGFA
jgi:hypothetical protein